MKLIAKTFHGLEGVLAEELKGIGAQNIKEVNRAVEFEGDKEILYKANLNLRTAIRILLPIHHFNAKNDQELYDGVQQFDWSTIMGVDETLAIDPVVYSEVFTHSLYVALKAKDAIVDQFREKLGKRPNVDVENPSVRLVIHIAKDKATISMDSSGDSLHKRGYRTGHHKAPLNEVLAAGMIMLSGWDKKMPLIDPMCGSGTILMEAVMYARNYPPNLHKKRFGFMGWKEYDEALWNKVVEEAKDKIEHPRLKIFGSDADIKAIDIARESALQFRFNRDINFSVERYEKLDPLYPKGMIIMNPPYGERLMKEKNVVDFYKMIGNQLKQTFVGYDAWVITSDKEALKNVGLKPLEKLKLYNGGLECGYHKFNIYDGTMKKIIKFR
ncbi:THUMP domain-containing class I SAM-dependent RNA methyltransferase [Labilibacter marinus]|uniref:THUMP domain-containing class I SAM-dependent RNA methyltransferase n=1 Tax=Labilibacter marinus TaxID=1477105 RepID=UPI00094FE14F|nr:THUMP domain-containing protein [Labilibacter marinus]